MISVDIFKWILIIEIWNWKITIFLTKKYRKWFIYDFFFTIKNHNCIINLLCENNKRKVNIKCWYRRVGIILN